MTTSFPSGHAAAAAAFAMGAALEMPVLAVPLGGLAAAVMASRVVTGAHYPTDVIAGALLGMGVSAWLIRLWRWDNARADPFTTDEAAPAPLGEPAHREGLGPST
jgi:membrane-associated phospholipid phosphatase